MQIQKDLNFLYKLLPLICGGLLMLGGANDGGIDAEGPGIGVGGLIGLLFGAVASFIVTNFLVLLFGRNATVVPTPENAGDAYTEGEDDAYAETPAQRVRRYVFRTLAIVALVAVLHECYWFANMWMATTNHNTGVYMTGAIANDYPREDLQEDLEAQRWRHEILSARPLKWLFGAEAGALNRANLELIDVVTGRRIEKFRSSLEDTPAAQSLVAIWRSDHRFGVAVTNRTLSIYGTALCNLTSEQVAGHKSRGWILRYLPNAWFR